MHLTLIISSLNSGGAQCVLSNLANHWCSQGHQISLITLDPPEFQPFYFLDSRISIIHLNKNGSGVSSMKRLKAIVDRFFALRKKIQGLMPNVIISFVDIMNVTTLISTLGLKIPIIVAERTHPKYYKLPILYQRLRLLFYPKAARVIVQTESAGHYFKNLKNIYVIPNAVPQPNILKKNTTSFPSHIISIGRLCPFKGFKTLIQAFSNLSQHYPKLTLTIYGEGQERENLENLIVSLNLRDKVYLPGAIKNVQEALIKADLFIFPSHYEGFPNALCEAMAVGLPVIASNCSGNIDIIREGVDGRLFPIGDIESLTKIALELLKDAEQRRYLSENALKIRNRFNPKHVFDLWDEIIDKATKN